jgi:predicted CDP-diglyceride synthetase/phosphatidate cytidylyltransferase
MVIMMVMMKLCMALEVVPSLSPLRYITPGVLGQYVLERAQATVWSGLLPVDQQDAVAIFISEGVSGFVGGIASKGTAAKKLKQSILA